MPTRASCCSPGSPGSTPIAEALENGAVGLVLKQQSPEILIKAINRVYAGEVWLDRTATARVIAELSARVMSSTSDPATTRTALLTKRERQVIMLVSEGLRNSQIAGRLSHQRGHGSQPSDVNVQKARFGESFSAGHLCISARTGGAAVTHELEAGRSPALG